MKISFKNFKTEYSSKFYDLNIEWLEKYFCVEDYDKEVLSKPEKYIIKNLMENIEYEYTRHQKKWNTITKHNWNKKINQLIQFNNERNDFMQEKINNLIDDED